MSLIEVNKDNSFIFCEGCDLNITNNKFTVKYQTSKDTIDADYCLKCFLNVKESKQSLEKCGFTIYFEERINY